MKNQKVFLLLIPFLLLGIVGCPRYNRDDCKEEYLFAIPVQCSPKEDNFKVNDTVWLEINIPATLTDSFSQVEKDISNFPFKIDVFFSRYDSIGFYFAADEFLYINEIGGLIVYGNSNPITRANMKKNIDGSYTLKVGCIPQKKGVYRLEFSTLAIDGIFERGYYDKNCYEEFFFQYDMNNNLDSNNFELLQHFPPSVVGGFESHKFYGCYAFQVVE